jgi:transcriptional regulator of acetoin/glycerol metabolism
VLLNAWVLSDSPVLEPDDFDIPDGHSHPPGARVTRVTEPEALRVPSRDASSESDHGSPKHAPKDTASRHRRDERERILQALQACNWNRVQAAKISGIPRRTFYRRLREYGIQ